MKINNEFTNENAHEWTELDHVYLVQDEPISGTGDYFEKAFRTLEEANDDAREQWHYLTERERKQQGRAPAADMKYPLALLREAFFTCLHHG